MITPFDVNGKGPANWLWNCVMPGCWSVTALSCAFLAAVMELGTAQ